MEALAGLAVCVPASKGSIFRERFADMTYSLFDEKLGSAVAASTLPSPCALAWRLRAGKCSSRSSALQAYSRGSGGHYKPAVQYTRDRVVDFGKNKGSMLGTLSSSYLRWMVKNLRNGMLDEWADYAQEVLDDPLYRDRIEWEKVEKLLMESHDLAKLTNNRDALAPARIYGWDLDNESAWSKVNFSLLGTSKGGQIPRKPIVKEPKKKAVTATATPRKSKVSIWTTAVEGQQQSPGSLRDELNRRRQLRRERLTAQRDAMMAGSKATMKEEQKAETRFPGREGLLNKLQEKRPQQ